LLVNQCITHGMLVIVTVSGGIRFEIASDPMG